MPMKEVNPQELAGIIRQRNPNINIENVEASPNDGNLVRVEFDGRPSIHNGDTEELLEAGFAISGIVPVEDGLNVFLRPVMPDTVDVSATVETLAFE